MFITLRLLPNCRPLIAISYSPRYLGYRRKRDSKFRMLLKLRQPGVYMGHGSFYNESGELVIFFPVLKRCPA